MPTSSEINTARNSVNANLQALSDSDNPLSPDGLKLALLSIIADAEGGGGGGSSTQYPEGDTTVTATGTVMLFRRTDGSLKAVQGDNSDNLQVIVSNAFALDATAVGIRDRLPTTLDGSGKLRISNELAPTTGISGQKTIAGADTFEALTTTTTLTSGVWVQCHPDNTGRVTVRYTGQTSGLVLTADSALFFAISDPVNVEVAVSVAGESVCWWGS